MSRIRWLLVVLIVVPSVAKCDPVIEIRVVSGADLSSTAPATRDVATLAASPTPVPDTPEATVTRSATVTPGMGEATATTPAQPSTTPSPSPTTPRSPTPTRPPATATPGPESGATRIRFRIGTISATVSGQLPSGGSRLYVLGASSGQLLHVSVASTASGMSFAVWGRDGTVLKLHAQDRATCILPSSQDYYVALYSGDQATRYHLSVTIPAAGGSGLTRIRFAPGATSAVVEDRLESGSCAYYVLAALAGQSMEVEVAPGEVVGLEVLGRDGSLWSSGLEGMLTVERLPQNGDYYLTLCAPSSAAATGYTLQVTIPPK